MALKGIDVSFYQGARYYGKNFDFAQAKKEGINYAIIKCGEKNFADPDYEINYKNAKAAGMPVGAYFVGRASTVADAKKEASYCSTLLKGKQFEFPIFYDVETPQMNTGKENLTSIVKAFCNAMEGYGYWCGFYTNLDWYTYKMNGKALAARYSFWFAWYSDSLYKLPNVQMWQPRAETIAGVYTDVDYCYTDYPTLIKKRGKNGFKKGGSVTPAPTPAPAPSTTTFAVGDKVKLKPGAVVWGTTHTFSPFVYQVPLYVLEEPCGNRVVFGLQPGGGVTGAVDAKYLQKV